VISELNFSLWKDADSDIAEIKDEIKRQAELQKSP